MFFPLILQVPQLESPDFTRYSQRKRIDELDLAGVFVRSSGLLDVVLNLDDQGFLGARSGGGREGGETGGVFGGEDDEGFYYLVSLGVGRGDGC